MTDVKVDQAVAQEKISVLERDQIKFDKRIDGVEEKIADLTKNVNSFISYLKFGGVVAPLVIGLLAYVIYQQPVDRLDTLEFKVEKVERSVSSLDVRFTRVEESVDKLTKAVEDKR